MTTPVNPPERKGKHTRPRVPVASYVGKKINAWTVLALGPVVSGNQTFICRCECGHERSLAYPSLFYNSKKCRACSVREQQQRCLSASLNGVLVDGHVRHACVDCGALVGSTPVRCRLCSQAFRLGRPYKHPVCLRIVASACGVSRQRVQQVAAADGWGGVVRWAMERYGVEVTATPSAPPGGSGGSTVAGPCSPPRSLPS